MSDQTNSMPAQISDLSIVKNFSKVFIMHSLPTYRRRTISHYNHLMALKSPVIAPYISMHDW